MYINTSFEICYNRIKSDTNRPLVMQNTKEQLLELYEKRSAVYRRNSMYMVNGNASDSVIVEEIAKLVRYSESN